MLRNGQNSFLWFGVCLTGRPFFLFIHFQSGLEVAFEYGCAGTIGSFSV